MVSKNLLVVGGLAVAGLYVGSTLFGYANLADQLKLRIAGARIHKISLQGIEIAVRPALNNPTKQSVTITKPVVSLYSSGESIGQSDASAQTVTIAAQQVTELPAIHITIGLMDVIKLLGTVKWQQIIALFSKPGDAAKVLKGAVKSPVTVGATTYADNIFIQTTPVRIL